MATAQITSPPPDHTGVDLAVAGEAVFEVISVRGWHAVNVGKQPYEQVTIFLLDRPDAVPQPREE